MDTAICQASLARDKLQKNPKDLYLSFKFIVFVQQLLNDNLSFLSNTKSYYKRNLTQHQQKILLQLRFYY